MRSLFQKKWFFPVLGGLLVLLLILNKILPSPKFVQNEGPEYKSIKLGVSSRQDVIKSLGDPLSISQKNAGEVLEYKSSNPNFNNEVEIVNEKASFIREVITSADNKIISTITDVYGEAPYSLYGLASGAGFKLYIYPDRGVAYIGHAASGNLLEIWYFTPMSYGDFKSNLAGGYSETQKFVQ